MSDAVSENPKPANSQDGDQKHVPVAEAIKYRRRAQQAEGTLQELEQQLGELQSRLGDQNDQLATAEAQRDEARMQLTVTENRLRAERRLSEAGVVDLETASMLLSKRVDFAEELDDQKLAESIEQLLLAKPFLHRSTDAALPPKTASPRSPQAATGQLASAAKRAAESGNRRDVAEYLRLRRRAAAAG